MPLTAAAKPPLCKACGKERVATPRSTLCEACFLEKCAAAGSLSSGNSERRSSQERVGARRTGALSSGNSERRSSKERAGARRAGALSSGNSKRRSNKERAGARRAGALSSGNAKCGATKRKAQTRSSTRRSTKEVLVVKEPWVGMILDGKKTWEIRGSATAKRGKIHLAASRGGGVLVGQCQLVDCYPVGRSELANNVTKHWIKDLALMPCERPHAGVLEKAMRYSSPFTYKRPQGANTWVAL